MKKKGKIPDHPAPSMPEIDPLKLPVGRFWKACMKLVPMPVDEWDKSLREIYQRNFASSLGPSAAMAVIQIFKPQMMAAHYRLARSVQPHGKQLDPLAAAIGAIRHKDKDYLSEFPCASLHIVADSGGMSQAFPPCPPS